MTLRIFEENPETVENENDVEDTEKINGPYNDSFYSSFSDFNYKHVDKSNLKESLNQVK